MSLFQAKVAVWRTLLLTGGGILAVLGSEKIGFGGAGPLGLIIAAFVASCGWHVNPLNEKVDLSISP